MELCCEAMEAIAVFAAKGQPPCRQRCGLRRSLREGGAGRQPASMFSQHQDPEGPCPGEEMNARCLGMLETYGAMADGIFETVKAGFSTEGGELKIWQSTAGQGSHRRHE